MKRTYAKTRQILRLSVALYLELASSALQLVPGRRRQTA